MPDLSFRARLATDLAAPARKGERTRARLLHAGVCLLDESPPAALQISQVCARGEVAKGTFYVHFVTKDAFLEQLCADYVAFEAGTFPEIGSAKPRIDDAYAQVHATVDWYERVFAANVGMLRCLVDMTAAGDAFMNLWLVRNRAIVDRMVASTRALLGVAERHSGGLRATINALGGMLDQSLYARYRVGPRWILGEGALESSIELHALIAYRALFGADPPRVRDARVRTLVRQTDLRARAAQLTKPAGGRRR